MPRKHRGRKRWRPPKLVIAQILAWADEHHARTGQWPRVRSGAVAGTPGETWRAVDTALVQGHRTLPGGSSLAQLLAEQRGARNRIRPPKLTAAQVLAWAEGHRRRTGAWPTRESGPVTDAPGETWLAIHLALQHGLRGFSRGSSLARVLKPLKEKLP